MHFDCYNVRLIKLFIGDERPMRPTLFLEKIDDNKPLYYNLKMIFDFESWLYHRL